MSSRQPLVRSRTSQEEFLIPPASRSAMRWLRFGKSMATGSISTRLTNMPSAMRISRVLVAFSLVRPENIISARCRPVPYPGRTPHIHFKVKLPSENEFTTQCYIKGNPQNDRDGVLRGIRDPQKRESVMVDFAPIKDSQLGELAAKFDIVLGVTPGDG